MALAIKHTVPAKRGKGDAVYIAFYFIRGAYMYHIMQESFMDGGSVVKLMVFICS